MKALGAIRNLALLRDCVDAFALIEEGEIN
jgi:hypothetical protein